MRGAGAPDPEQRTSWVCRRMGARVPQLPRCLPEVRGVRISQPMGSRVRRRRRRWKPLPAPQCFLRTRFCILRLLIAFVSAATLWWSLVQSLALPVTPAEVTVGLASEPQAAYKLQRCREEGPWNRTAGTASASHTLTGFDPQHPIGSPESTRSDS